MRDPLTVPMRTNSLTDEIELLKDMDCKNMLQIAEMSAAWIADGAVVGGASYGQFSRALAVHRDITSELGMRIVQFAELRRRAAGR